MLLDRKRMPKIYTAHPKISHRGYFFLPEGHKNTLREPKVGACDAHVMCPHNVWACNAGVLPFGPEKKIPGKEREKGRQKEKEIILSRALTYAYVLLVHSALRASFT